MTLKNTLLVYLSKPKELKDIYGKFRNVKRTTIRGRLNENTGSVFKRIERGVYVATKNDFSIVLADPPWKYGNNTSRGNALQHYNTMDIEDIKSLPVNEACGKDAVLFLWTTGPMIPDALDVMKDWGFTYKTIGFIWIKTNSDGSVFLGVGNYTRSNGEICLIGVKGKGLQRLQRNISQVILSHRTRHSEKPQQTYTRIEELYGEQERLELFARKRRQGWYCFGNETDIEEQRVLQ